MSSVYIQSLEVEEIRTCAESALDVSTVVVFSALEACAVDIDEFVVLVSHFAKSGLKSVYFGADGVLKRVVLSAEVDIEEFSIVEGQGNDAFCAGCCGRGCPDDVFVIHKLSLCNFPNQHLGRLINHSYVNRSSYILALIIFQRQKALPRNLDLRVS